MNIDKILIDTSVWIDYFKNRTEKLVNKVESFIKEKRVFIPKIVIAELIQGARSEKEINVIEELADAFYIISEEPDTWKKAGILSYRLKKKGKTINLADCYIAIIAKENDCKMFTLDPHFQEVKEEVGIEIIPLD